MAECVIREAKYLGDGLWSVDAAYTDETGTRMGAVCVSAPEEAETAVLADAVAALYA